MSKAALTLAPVAGLAGTVQLPGSKSISNRALLLAALAAGETRLHNLLASDDTAVMLAALEQLGVSVERGKDETVVHGQGRAFHHDGVLELDLGLAGTAYRPLAAVLASGQGCYRLDGVPRMRERPIGDLVDALRPLGAQIRYLGESGFPPVEVIGRRLTGGATEIRGDVSSQFLSALLLAAPLAGSPVQIGVVGELVSKPYVTLNLDLMARFGVTVQHEALQRFSVEPTTYQSPGTFQVEGDASSASYFLAAGAIAGAGVTVRGVGAESIQGDVAFVDVLRAMGAEVLVEPFAITVRPGERLSPIDMDLNHIPDAAMTAATLALFAKGRSRIRNIANWRVKETDRLTAMATELRKVGATVVEGADYLEVEPPDKLQPAVIDTYGDHRMAMAFSLVCLGGVPVTINDPGCVAKTFPDYFERFSALCP